MKKGFNAKKRIKVISEERIISIDVLRVIAILLVIGFHFTYQITLDNSLRKIGFIGISLFFIISGYVLARNYPKLDKFSLKWFLRRYIKIASLYYLAIISIVLLFKTQTYSGKLSDILLHFLFLDPLSPSAAYSIISPAWFLTPLLGLYVFFPYLNKYVKKDLSFLIIAFFIMTVMRTLNGNYTSYSPLFFIGDFCFGIAFFNGKKYPALLISLITIFINPVMFLPFLIFFLVYHIKFQYIPSNFVHFIGANIFSLFLFHEAFIKVLFGKWHIYNFDKSIALFILCVVVLLCGYFSKRIQDFFFDNKFFTRGIYAKEFL